MARTPRKISETKYYHIMIKGNDDKGIFIDDEDKWIILNIVRKKLKMQALTMYAYCIMETHAHFLIKEDKENISDIMKRINISYASYFNKKYNRVGHVFQDRFKSECIDCEKNLLPVIRYIHNDPTEYIVNQLNYKWSSYQEYIHKNIQTLIVENEKILSLFAEEYDEAIKKFIQYSNVENNDIFLDVEESIENIINKMIERYLYKNNIRLKDLGYKKNIRYRIDLILMIKDKGNLSIRKIAQLLNLSRGMVYKVLNEHYKK
ncbi:MAG: transposase [Eubacteriaceae bacterium]